MRRGHFVILFGMLLVLLLTDYFIGKMAYRQAAKEKQSIDYALQMAADSAAGQLAGVYRGTDLQSCLDSASDAFFVSLAAGLGLYEDMDGKEGLSFLVPALLVACDDGFYVNYLEEDRGQEASALRRTWTECQPYSYSDNKFIYRFFLDDRVMIYEKDTGRTIKITAWEIFASAELMPYLAAGTVFLSEADYLEHKRAAVSDSIATALERIMDGHSLIAGQLGISMVYTVPDFFQSFTPALEQPSFVALFQGYPLAADEKIIYNGASASAAYVSEVCRYEVEVSTSPGQPFSVYHREGCSAAGAYGHLLRDKYTEGDAVSIYGAYACPHCFDEADGVAVLP